MWAKTQLRFAIWLSEDDDIYNIEAMKRKFLDYCELREKKPAVNLFPDSTRAQGRTEIINVYVTDLKSKARDCVLGQLSDRLIRDRIAFGIREDQVRGRDLREADFTLKKAVDVCVCVCQWNHLKYSMMKLKYRKGK